MSILVSVPLLTVCLATPRLPGGATPRPAEWTAAGPTTAVEREDALDKAVSDDARDNNVPGTDARDNDAPDDDAPDDDAPDDDAPDDDAPGDDAPDDDAPDDDAPDERGPGSATSDNGNVDDLNPDDGLTDGTKPRTRDDDARREPGADEDGGPRAGADRGAAPQPALPAVTPAKNEPDAPSSAAPGEEPSLGAAATVADRRPVELFPPPAPAATWRAGAFIDVAYGFAHNLPNNRLFRGQLTTPRTGEFTLNNATAFLDHAATDDEPWIFEIALQAGAAVDAVVAAEPVPGGDDGAFAGAEVFKHVGRANAGARLRSGTTLRGGLFASPLGIGSTWTKDNWNYTTSWAANAAPYYLMGAMVEQALPQDFAIQAWVINGWQTIADVNRAPSYLVGVVRNRNRWNFTSQVYFGPEGIDLAPKGWRVHWDTMAGYAGRRWGIAGVVDFGRDRLTELPGQPEHLWLLAAGFVHGEVWQNDHTVLDLAARPEIMWDRDGLLFGVPQIMVGETVTLSARVWDHLLFRLEYRYDRSTASNGFFYRRGATSDTDRLARQQHTIFAGLVGYWQRMLGGRRTSASKAKAKQAARAFPRQRRCGEGSGSRRGPKSVGCGGRLASHSSSRSSPSSWPPSRQASSDAR